MNETMNFLSIELLGYGRDILSIFLGFSFYTRIYYFRKRNVYLMLILNIHIFFLSLFVTALRNEFPSNVA